MQRHFGYVFRLIWLIILAVGCRLVIGTCIYAEHGEIARMARPHPVVRIPAEFSDRAGRSEHHTDIIENIVDNQEILVIIIERYDIGSLKFRVSHRIGHRLPDRVGCGQTQVLFLDRSYL